jgi:hypothetical protein
MVYLTYRLQMKYSKSKKSAKIYGCLKIMLVVFSSFNGHQDLYDGLEKGGLDPDWPNLACSATCTNINYLLFLAAQLRKMGCVANWPLVRLQN